MSSVGIPLEGLTTENAERHREALSLRPACPVGRDLYHKVTVKILTTKDNERTQRTLSSAEFYPNLQQPQNQ